MPSTALRAFDYDPQRRELTVTFVTGRVYRYGRVPAEVYDGLKTARSRGAFFNRHIRGPYPYRELTAPPQEHPRRRETSTGDAICQRRDHTDKAPRRR